MYPRGSANPRTDEGPPLPRRPNGYAPQPPYPQVPVPTRNPYGLSNEAVQPSSGAYFISSDSYVPHERDIHRSPVSAPSGRRFSWSSALRQVTETILFGGPVASPQASLFASSVIVNGVELGQADLLGLQAFLGVIMPGNYWYDRRSGAYGSVGGPCTGFLAAGLALGNGQLDQHASGNTGTRVFVNGREIHAMDVVSLQAMGVPVRTGMWWVNGDGSFGMEGSPIPLGNLRRQAMANSGAGAGSGGAHTWSTNMGHYGGSDGQGFTYIGGPGWSYSSG